MQNRHQKISFYQILLLSCLDIPPQCMNLTLILTILSNIPTVLLLTDFHSDILILIKVRISLVWHVFLQHTRWYLLNITQKIKHREIHTPFKHVDYLISRPPAIINNSPCYCSGRFDIGSPISRHISSFEYTYTIEKEITYFFCNFLSWTTNFFFSTTAWTHPISSFLILLILPYLVFSSIFPTFAFTTDPTQCLSCSASYTSSTVQFWHQVRSWCTWGGRRGAGGWLAIAVANSQCAIDLFFV